MHFKRLLLGLVPVILLLSACATGAGVFAGGSWQAGGLQQQHIRALAVDPNNVQLIYAGDAQKGIFVSADAGQHWAQRDRGLPLPIVVSVLAFDASGKKLYAASDVGIFVSADGAQHWRAVGTAGAGLPRDSYTALAFDFNVVHTFYVGTEHSGVFVSKDDGVSWSNVSKGLPLGVVVHDLALDSLNHRLWAATEKGSYRSDDQGKTWQALNGGLPADVVVYAVQPADVNGGAQGLVYAGTNHGFFRSEDGGAHWVAGRENLAGTSIRSILIDFRQSQATTLYVATDLGVFRSNDSGETWSGVASGLPRDRRVYALALGVNDYSQLYAAVDDVYLYPGSSGGLNITNLLPILLVLLFFYLLYRFTGRGRKSSRQMLKPERIIETSIQDKVQFGNASPPATRHDVSEDAEDGQEKGS